MKMKPDIETLFSPGWYGSENPDVAEFPGGRLTHYRLFGWREGRSPHPLFDVQWYLQQTPELLRAGTEPLGHYLDRGWREMRSPHPLFDPAWYLLQNPDVLALDVDPWQHYLQTGWQTGCNPHPLFDVEWYLDAYADVAEAGLEPLGHYLRRGWREGRNPHPLFAPGWYRAEYDLAETQDPWRDYVQSGWEAGRNPHPLFDANWYQDRYLDPITLPVEPLGHYLSEGWREGLLPHPDYVAGAGATSTDQAPLYCEQRGIIGVAAVARQARQNLAGLRADGRRGRVLLVTHDTQLGGAQTVLRLLADWLQSSTRFSVGIVAVNGGHFRPQFEAIAPVFVLSDHPEKDRAAALADWAGEDVQAIFVNSIVSGSFYRYWPAKTPSVAFIHELPQILERYPDEVDLVRARADHVISGGPGVFAALKDGFGFDPERLTSAYSYIEALPKGDTEADRQARRTSARNALAVPDDRILVMGCGVLHWRKSPDKFIETAQAVLAAGLDAEFVWLGGGPDEAACIAQVKAAGIADRVRFTGYEPEVAAKLAGADIFLLSSQEDPFPLVALYAAQAGAPLVCFQEAGGIADFVETGSGVAVPFMDVAAMAEAVLVYGRDAERRARDGQVGCDQVARKHTINAVGPMLLHHLRRVAGLAPEVSVVLPNYNYEAYLPQRLDSIIAQQFQDFELILLDDASSDGSPALLEDFAQTRAGTRLALNRDNSGSPFAQWLRGMEMAEAEIIWLAEADDWCEANLLTTLLPMFDDRNLRLASCMSVPVQSDGTVIGDYPSLYLDRINPGRWDSDFTATDHEEANEGLGIANTIPNASAVLMRKFDPDPEFVDMVTGMRLCGDWFFYIRAMKGGLVGFSAAPLNYHRRHGGTVTHKLEGSLRYFTELADVRAYIGRTYRQSSQAQAQVAQFLEQDITRFKVSDREALPAPVAPAKALPALAVIAPDLSPGGGQMFAISLANEWSHRGGRVVLINAHSQPTHPAVLSKLDPEVALYHANEDGFDLAGIVARYDIDLIHSNIWWADVLVDSYRDSLPADLPWVITMHGCHETLMTHPGIDRAFPERMTRMIGRVDGWVYLADKNIGVFDHYPRPDRLLRIPNGMAAEPIGQVLDRAALGLRPEALVLCLAARAIPSKGWHEAVAAVETLNAEGHAVDLILCGEGPAAEAIRAEAPAHVLLTGQIPNVQDYFAISDVGILPSYFIGESLPLSLLEMMAKGLPLIASDVGEIPSIVGTGEAAAGLLVPLTGDPEAPALDMEAFLAALRQMLDGEVRARMAANAHRRFEAEYRLDRMVDSYARLYDEVGAGRWGCQTAVASPETTPGKRITKADMSLAAPLFDLTKPAVRTDAAGYTHARYAQYTKLSQHIYGQILKIFQKFDLQYYLFAGSALGYVRNGEMQPWVDDLDVILFEEHVEYFETTVLPFLKRCGLHCSVPVNFKTGGYHILAMQQGNQRSLSIPFSDALEVSVPWAQVDVFFTSVDAEGFLRNPSAWGLYHKKDVPLDWVVPGQEVTFEGWETRLFSKCKEDVLHEYGDVLNHIMVATHGEVFLNRPNTAWADFEASFDQLVAQSTTDYPPCCDARMIREFQAAPGCVYTSDMGQGFDGIVSGILAERASRLHLRDGDQIYWVMDLRRLFPALRIDVDITNERELYRAALLRAFIDKVNCPDAALSALHQTCIDHLSEIDV